MSEMLKWPPGFRIRYVSAKALGFVGNEVHHAVAYHHIGEVIGQGHVFNVAIDEFDVAVAQRFGVFTGAVDHGGGHVQPNYATRLAGFGAGHEAVVARPRTEVNHDIAGFDLGKLRGQAAAQTEVGIGRVAVDGGVLIVHQNAVRGIGTGRAAAARRAAATVHGYALCVVGLRNFAVFLADNLFEIFVAVVVMVVRVRGLHPRVSMSHRDVGPPLSGLRGGKSL